MPNLYSSAPGGEAFSHPATEPLSLPTRRSALLAQIGLLAPAIRARAPALDREARFPAEDITALRASGALMAPLPSEFGGLGLGTEPEAAAHLCDLLHLLGYCNVSVARLYEAHVNAIRLVAIFGSPALMARVKNDVLGGHLIALWVTDSHEIPLTADANGKLHGGKAFCSGAGHIERSLVTCKHPDGGTRLAYLSTAAATAARLPAGLQGLRAAVTGQVAFDRLTITDDDWIGRPGDYLSEPDFSAGAWRTSAITAGCLARLVDLAIFHLADRQRAGDPHQQTRIGRSWIARETALLWAKSAAHIAEGAMPASPDSIGASVNFARIAIESASVDALNMVERSIGLQAYLAGTEIERIRRDLSTYLRQPAPDEALAEAASYIVRTRPRPS